MKLSEIIRYYPFVAYNKIKDSNLNKYISLRERHEDMNEALKYTKEKEEELKKYALSYSEFYRNMNPEFRVIDKTDIQKYTDEFISSEFDKENLFTTTTSGSFGEPTTFYRTKQKKQNVIADVLYNGQFNNYFFGSHHAFMRGISKSKLNLFVQNEIHMQSGKLGKNELLEYYMKLRKVNHVIGFKSIMFKIMEFAEEFKLPQIDNLKGITLTSEKVDVDERDKLEEYFGCPVLCRYASEELGIIANRRTKEEFYRINHSSYALKIFDFNKDEEVEDGKEGRIIITDLNSHAMPLINYDIGDVGIIENVNINNQKVRVLKSILGRKNQMLYDENDDMVTPFALTSLFKDYTSIKRYQFIQKDKGVYRLLIKGTRDQEEELTEKLKQIFGYSIDLSFEIVEEIPVLPSGKTVYILNEYKPE